MPLNGNLLTLTGVSVSEVNDLLGASYKLYRHSETNETILRTLGYSLPEGLHSLVQTVLTPTTHFASQRTLSQTPRKQAYHALWSGKETCPSQSLLIRYCNGTQPRQRLSLLEWHKWHDLVSDEANVVPDRRKDRPTPRHVILLQYSLPT